jgi:hypothetical protein
MRRRGPSPVLGPTYPHEIQGVGIDDVEAAASIHDNLGETSVADDGVDDKQILPMVWDVVQVVIPIKGDGVVGPV